MTTSLLETAPSVRAFIPLTCLANGTDRALTQHTHRTGLTAQ